MSSDQPRDDRDGAAPEEPEATAEEVDVAEAREAEAAEATDEDTGTEQEPGESEEAGDAADADVAGEEGAEQAAGKQSWLTPKRLVVGASALAIAAFLVAGLFGVMWWVAAADDKSDLATSREAVEDAGRNAVKAFTELDYTNPDAYFARNKAVSTDKMIKQIEQTEDTYRKALAEAKTTVVTTVQDIAVQELNDHEGKASFLAVVTTDITKGEQKGSKTLRLKGQMERVGESWKLAGISEVPIVGSGKQGK